MAERSNVVVVGAGPAGLATAVAASHVGLSVEVLEAGPSVATTWRTHYDRLHLHTTRALSALPRYPIPCAAGRWVARDDFIAYLEACASRAGLPIRFDTRVERVDSGAGEWELTTNVGRVGASTVVIATGYNHKDISRRLVIRGYHVAVKTGTSDSFADAWTLGFTPHIAVAVWMGNPDWRIKMTQGSDSSYVAVPAWHAFLANALPLFGGDAWYIPPAGLVQEGSNYYLPGTTKHYWRP